MAKIEAFIVIEETVREVVFKAIQKAVTSITKDVRACLEVNDYTEADRLIRTFTLNGLLDSKRKHLREVLLTALIFGQSQLVPAKLTALTTGAMEVPDVLDDAIDQLIILIETQMVDQVQKTLRNEVAKDMAEDELVPFSKAITVTAPEEVENYTKAGVGTRANLITSRLVSFGFLSQARTVGIEQYQINEKLDTRTCPVCKYMHGHVFNTGAELEKLTLILKTKNPEELKGLAPWPSQTKEGLKALYSMTPADMQAAGYSVPPFHPMCRGILVKVGTTERVFFPSAKEKDTGVPEVDMDWLDEAGGTPEQMAPFKKALKGLDQAAIISRMFGGEAFGNFTMDLWNRTDGASALEFKGTKGTTITRMTRDLVFKDGELSVTHGYFKVDSAQQGGGLAKKVLKSSFALYKEIGVSRVELEANINVGSYAWAKYGFQPTLSEWASLQATLVKRIENLDAPMEVRAMLETLALNDDPKTIWVISDSIYGKELLMDTSWEGFIDLADDMAMDRFNGYVSK